MTFFDAVVGRLAPPQRLTGIDVARGVALFGMMLTHTVALATLDGESTVSTFWAGKASALFAVLAGMSIVFSTRQTLAVPGLRPWAGAATGLVLRGIVITLIGLLLGTITGRLAIILANYGLMFIIATLFLRWRAWMLAVLAGMWLTLSPIISHALRADFGLVNQFTVPGIESLSSPAWLFEALALTGYYPVFQWMGYVLAGMALAYVPWRNWLAALIATGGGLLLASTVKVTSTYLTEVYALPVLQEFYGTDSPELDTILLEGAHGVTSTETWWWLVTTAPHSATPFDLWYTLSTSVAIIGLACLLAAGFAQIPSSMKTPAPHRAWLAGLSAPGSMPLSVYTAHAIFLEFTGAVQLIHPYPELLEWCIHVAVLGGASLLWKAFISARGPLEMGLSTMTRRVTSAIATPSTTRSTPV